MTSSEYARDEHEPDGPCVECGCHPGALVAENETLRAALEEVQWNGYAYIGLEPCPSCANERVQGHDDQCIVGNALAAARGGAAT